jgi:hypothetical protein
MVRHQAYDQFRNHFLLGPLTSGLCYGLSTSSNQVGHLHGATTRDSNQAWELQRICFEAREEYLRPKTGWAMWNSFLVDKLTSIGFTRSLIDDCVFFRGDVIFMVYMDDVIFLGRDDLQLQEVIKEIQNLGLNIEDQGHPAN